MSRLGAWARSGAVGAALALATQHLLVAHPPGGAARWERTNHRGARVTLLSGPAVVLAATAAAATARTPAAATAPAAATPARTPALPVPAAAAAAVGAALVGAYDDLVGGRDAAKGLRGHLDALRHGRVTTGAVKVVGIGTTGVLSAALLGGRGRDVLVGGAVVAGAANLLNLLDLRPGRALKAATAAALLLSQPGQAAAALALLPADLRERTMLGDAGANGLGALLGLSLLHRSPHRRMLALAVLMVATAASEVVSYSRVIDAVPPLRWVDHAGRLP